LARSRAQSGSTSLIVDVNHSNPPTSWFAHIEFPSARTEKDHLLALEQLFAQKASEPVYIYAGGFFTSIEWRGSGLAAVLGMAAIAMARLQHSRFAASFTSARDRAPELFGLLGGTPLRLPSGQVLSSFVCQRFRMPLQLLAFDSMCPQPRVEEGLREVASRLEALMTPQAMGAAT
jgi:hypothetical protein